MNNKQELLKSGSIWKVIASLTIPTIIITLVMAIYNMADVFFIGKTGNADMVNAISVCMPIFTVVQAFGTLAGAGGCTAISVSLGRKDVEKTKNISSFCFYFCIIAGLVLALGLSVFAPQMVTMLGAGASYSSYAVIYLRILAIGCPIMMFSNAFVNILRADGSIKESMAANLAGTFVNIILDPILILGFGMGVGGAAAATVIGNLLSAVIVLSVIRKKGAFLSLSPRKLSKDRDTSLHVLALGLPVASGTLLLSVAYMIMNNLLLSVSPYAQGAFGVSRAIMLFSTMIQLGICMGIQPAISYNYGMKNMKRVKEFVIKTGIVSVGFGLFVAIACIGFKNIILNAFVSDARILEYGKTLVVGCFITAPIYGLFQLSVNFLQATDRPMWSTILTVLRQGVIIIPAMLILNYIAGFQGLTFCFAVTDIIAAIIGLILIVIRMKELDSESDFLKADNMVMK